MTAVRGMAVPIALALALALPRAGRTATVTLTLAPAETTMAVGDMISVRVLVGAVSDLKGCALVYRYSPEILQLVGAEAGAVLAGGIYVDFLRPDVAPPDSILYDAARLDGTAAGPGVLACFRLRAAAEGDAALECGAADLRDSLNRTLETDCAGALVHVRGATSVVRVPWGQIKVRYR